MKFQTRKVQYTNAVYLFDMKMKGIYRKGVIKLEKYLTALSHLS